MLHHCSLPLLNVTYDEQMEYLTFSGADLSNLVNQAAIRAAVESEPYVTMKHLEWAKDKIIMGMLPRLFYFILPLNFMVHKICSS